MPSGRGPIDIVYISPEGGITIVETKLWKNPEKHRVVVAQIIDYAKQLASWTYTDLSEAVLTASRLMDKENPRSLTEIMRPHLEEPVRQRSILKRRCSVILSICGWMTT